MQAFLPKVIYLYGHIATKAFANKMNLGMNYVPGAGLIPLLTCSPAHYHLNMAPCSDKIFA